MSGTQITSQQLRDLAHERFRPLGQTWHALTDAADEIDRLKAKCVELNSVKSAIRQVWPYLEEDYNMPNICTTQGYRDAIARLGRIIGEVAE